MIEFTEICESYINGNKKQALEQVQAFGWYDFTTDLQDCPILNSAEKLEMLCVLIRLDNR